ncbi:hypothetical protein FRC09_008959 [Ceratobasidium sp. 395]|nr:hypothetical protein FRC09_008959 [Ceratobasidium sp. 395]
MELAHMSIQEPDQTTATLINVRPSRDHEDAQADITTTSATATTSTLTLAPNPLPALSPTPDQEEIETWVAKFQKHRRSSKSHEGLAIIVCPLPGCGHVSRRPHALKRMGARCARNALRRTRTESGINDAVATIRDLGVFTFCKITLQAPNYSII